MRPTNSASHSDNERTLLLSLDALVRSIGIRSNRPLSVFVGAGASISSGIPSAQMCIWEWKHRIFLTNHPGIEDGFSELSLPGVRRRIQRWLDDQGGFPPDAALDEYGFYIQKCYPIWEDRRTYFRDRIRDSRPHVGYQLLCYLAETGLLRTVWSTNFDGLVARAAASFDLTPLEIGIDSQHRIVRTPEQGEIQCISLHGDYRYDALKNTAAELQVQEDSLHKALIEQARSIPLIVIGYSGRDRSVLETLRSAYCAPGSGILYWCGFGEDAAPSNVEALIYDAREHGRHAYYIPTLGFDDLMIRLAQHCLSGKQRDAARRSIATHAQHDTLQREPFQVKQSSSATLIKSNAFEVECPTEVFQFDLKTWPRERVWAFLHDTAGDRPLVAVPFRKVLALGSIEDVRDAFGNNIKGSIERTPVAPKDFFYDDGAVVSLMRQALIRSLAKRAGLETDGAKILWNPSAGSTERHGSDSYRIHEAAQIYLRRIGGLQHLILMPTLKVFELSGHEAPRDVASAIKLRILGYQHNIPFNKAVNHWRARLFPKEQVPVFEFPPESGSTFKFRVRRSPIFARVGLPAGGPRLKLPDSMDELVKHFGVQLIEPPLLFSNIAGSALVKDTHPIRGILHNRPYDYPLTSRGLSSLLRIGIVCPQTETGPLHAYLQGIHRRHTPGSTERDYLLDYPGFQAAYGLPVEVPAPDSPGWLTCPEPSTHDSIQGSLDVSRLINRSIDTLRASYAPDVVLIYVPDRWTAFRGYTTESESFDLHNFVKAFCVQRGIATQFLNEDTLTDAAQCRVWWWLSLALYVKGMRTPWLLDDLADDTAFVGLGFSVDRSAPRGDHVVLGCSHIYSARGEGLQYRLSKIESPIMRGGNPFMSEDDARRVGETIRQLFFDARMQLPKRVVFHKQTGFTREEREGLRDGLEGIKHFDMLEIQFDHALRYMASVQRRDGKIDEDNYPVWRGTALKIDDYGALLWVHGSTTALNPRLRYFQGKRRIPGPLIVRRHAGTTPLERLAGEILGLSKMNWNTFDLYTKLPATLQSSSEIAKIGSLLQRFGSASYDYRLFI